MSFQHRLNPNSRVLPTASSTVETLATTSYFASGSSFVGRLRNRGNAHAGHDSLDATGAPARQHLYTDIHRLRRAPSMDAVSFIPGLFAEVHSGARHLDVHSQASDFGLRDLNVRAHLRRRVHSLAR